jgi:Tfp pilus assembly protein FimT
VTLIELLVVVSIMLIVTVVAVPAMKPALESRKIREAARALNVYLGSARNHAIELGRPVGVLFNRDSTQGNPCLTLQQVEIPAPYAGDTTNSAAFVYLSGSSASSSGTTYTVQITFNPAVNANLFDGGDYIQFGYQGPLYTIANNPAPTASSAMATITLPPNCTVPWPATAPGVAVPFQITIQPDNNTLPAPSAVAPLQLPAGTVIDLQASGWQAPGTSFNSNLWFGVGATNPAVLLFSPTGGVYGVYANLAMYQLVDPVYFLVGRRDRMFTLNLTSNATIPQTGAAGEVVPADGLANWQDPNNLWVSVAPQTGRISTVDSAVVANPTSMTNAAAIVLARRFALQGQSKGGR